ncbi:MAG: hypothetical protein VYA69_03635 [Gemmatimonadota bacterium]|nr:hypothetical protein [Gemmatimonadota bacterium]
MINHRILIIASNNEIEAVYRLSKSFNVTGLYMIDGSIPENLSTPTGPSFVDLLEKSQPDLCVILAALPSLCEEINMLLSREVSILTAGPIKGIAGDGNNITVVPLSKWSLPYQQLKAECQKESFGDPVFLRYLTSGGHNLHSAWWAMCQAVDVADGLLQGALTALHVSGISHNQTYHINATLLMSNRANGQLSIVPDYLEDERQVTLLGTGGLLNYDPQENVAGIVTGQSLITYKRMDHCSYTNWLTAYLEDRETLKARHQTVLSPDQSDVFFDAIKVAIAAAEPVRVELI